MSPLSLTRSADQQSSVRVMLPGSRAMKQALTAAEVRAALLRAAYMLHATRVVGWKEGVPVPKKG